MPCKATRSGDYASPCITAHSLMSIQGDCQSKLKAAHFYGPQCIHLINYDDI